MDNNGNSNTVRVIVIVFVAAMVALFLNSLIWYGLEESKEASRGEYLLSHGQYDDAAKELSVALTKHPSDSKLRCELGEAYLRGGKPEVALNTFMTMFEMEPNTQQAGRVRDLLSLYDRKPLNDKAADAMVLVAPNGKGAFVARGIPTMSPPIPGDDPENAPEMRIETEKIELAYISTDGKEEKKLALYKDFPALLVPSLPSPNWAPDSSGLALLNSTSNPTGAPSPLGLYWLPVDGKGAKHVYTPSDPDNDIKFLGFSPSNEGQRFAMVVTVTPKPKVMATPGTMQGQQSLPPSIEGNVNDPIKPATSPAPVGSPPPADMIAPVTAPAEPYTVLQIVEAGKTPQTVLRFGTHQHPGHMEWVAGKLYITIMETKSGTDNSHTLLAQIDLDAKRIERIGLPDAVYASFTPNADGTKMAVLTADYDQNGDGVINDNDRHHLAILDLAKNSQYGLEEFPVDLNPIALLQMAPDGRILAVDECWGNPRLLVFNAEGRFVCSPAQALNTEGLTGIRLVDGGKRALLLDTTHDYNNDGIVNNLDGRAAIIDLAGHADPRYVGAQVREMARKVRQTKSK